MATHILSFLPISLPASPACREKPPKSPLFLPWSSFYGEKLFIRQPNLKNFVSKCHLSTIATALSTLPTKNYPSEKKPKWSARAIRSFGFGELEARKLKYPNTGTEALLMGILIEGANPAAKFLRDNGITFFKVQEEIVNLLGKSDLYVFSPEHPPLTEQAQRALDWAIEEKLKSGDDGEVTTSHLLLGIWSEIDSAGHKILATLGFNDDKAKELAKSIPQDSIKSFR